MQKLPTFLSKKNCSVFEYQKSDVSYKLTTVYTLSMQTQVVKETNYQGPVVQNQRR